MRGVDFDTAIDETVSALAAAGVVRRIAGGAFGYRGCDGRAYRVPDRAGVLRLRAEQAELVRAACEEGFEAVVLTPIAAATRSLLGAVVAALSTWPVDAGVRVRREAPLWIWERIRPAIERDEAVYFPRRFAPLDHGGLSKRTVATDPRICAFDGWSLCLVRRTPAGESRRCVDLPAGLSPADYRALLDAPEHADETGWTIEDFLAGFLVALWRDRRPAHLRDEEGAIWLLGSYFPDPADGFPRDVVATAFFQKGRLWLSTHRSRNRARVAQARTAVRLARAAAGAGRGDAE